MSYYGDENRGRRRRRSRSRERDNTRTIFVRNEDDLSPRCNWPLHPSSRVRSNEIQNTFPNDRSRVITQRRIVLGPPRQRSRSADYFTAPSLRQQQQPWGADFGNPIAGGPSYSRPRSIERQRSDSVIYRQRPQLQRTVRGFRHRSLSRPSKQYRLIKVLPYKAGSPIRCIVRHAEPGTGSWAAVSYNWGIEEASNPILIGHAPDQSDAQPFLVTKNLSEILLHIARMQVRNSQRQNLRWNEWWWIDALCIIQNDEHPEKDIQIKSMPKFYMGAFEVFAWIGPGDPITDTAMRYIRNQLPLLREATSRGFGKAHLASFESSFHVVAHCIHDIFRRPYWTRLWILQELAMSPTTTLACGNEELPWRTFVDFAIQVAAADFGPNRVLRHVQRDIVSKQPIWLLTSIIQRRKRGPNLAELVFLSMNAECGKDKKDYVRALLGMVDRGRGLDIDAEEHRSACSIISHATRAIIQDMWDDERIPPELKRRCEKQAHLAHHRPLVVGGDIERQRAYCTNYQDAQRDCRDIAATLYEQTVLLRSRIKFTGETWDFEYDGMRRRRSRSRSRSGSRSSIASRGGDQGRSSSVGRERRPSNPRGRRRSDDGCCVS